MGSRSESVLRKKILPSPHQFCFVKKIPDNPLFISIFEKGLCSLNTNSLNNVSITWQLSLVDGKKCGVWRFSEKNRSKSVIPPKISSKKCFFFHFLFWKVIIFPQRRTHVIKHGAPTNRPSDLLLDIATPLGPSQTTHVINNLPFVQKLDNNWSLLQYSTPISQKTRVPSPFLLLKIGLTSRLQHCLSPEDVNWFLL